MRNESHESRDAPPRCLRRPGGGEQELHRYAEAVQAVMQRRRQRLPWQHSDFLGQALLVVQVQSLPVLSSIAIATAFRAGICAALGCLLFRIAFSFSLGPLPFVLTAELFAKRSPAERLAGCGYS